MGGGGGLLSIGLQVDLCFGSVVAVRESLWRAGMSCHVARGEAGFFLLPFWHEFRVVCTAESLVV